MQVRRIKTTDKDEYINLVTEFYNSDAVLAPVDSSHFDKTFAELMRSSERVVCYVADIDGKLAGYALIARFFSQEAGGEVAWLDEIYIRDEFRGKGAGTAIINKVFEDFKDAAAFRLEIEPENEGAERLYKRLGFQKLDYEQRIKYNHKI